MREGGGRGLLADSPHRKWIPVELHCSPATLPDMAAQKAPQTPQPDEPAGQTGVANPAKGRRWRIWADGDYCVYEAAAPSSGLPAGALVPIPDVPHFASKREADTWIDNSGDLLGGKGLYILRVHDILKVDVEPKPVLTIHRKEKIQVAGPETENSG